MFRGAGLRVLVGVSQLVLAGTVHAEVAAADDAAAVELAMAQDAGTIIVTGHRQSYGIDIVSAATRTPTPLNDVPQAVAVITEAQIDDQALRSVGEALRFVPGVTVAQGEGHRDQIILRGNNSTADFFIDGLRDDVQYYRGLYNVERIEVLKGPNAMIFGRGGGGGVVNRVTKRPLANSFVTGSASLDQEGAWHVDADVNQFFNAMVAARLNAVYEEFDSFRDVYEGRRFAINPTLALSLGGLTRIDLSYEYDDDERVIDRGVPSAGPGTVASPARPLRGFRRAFFGVEGVNVSDFSAHVGRARIERRFTDDLTYTGRLLYGDYDKVYSNVFPATAVTAAGQLGVEAYRDPTSRQNFLSQNDLVWTVTTGPLRHVLLGGIEYADQSTRNARINGTFPPLVAGGAPRLRATVPLADPLVVPPVTFGAPVRAVRSEAEVLAFYAQDQLSIGANVDLVLGIRHDRFDLSVDDSVDALPAFRRTDNLWSPRAGVVLKPTAAMSIYASYSRSYLPQSGDQFLSLDATAETLEPEKFENLELGFKWDILPAFSLNAALYRLDRTNSRAPDPTNPARVLQTGEQRSEGFEIGVAGEITARWHLTAGYALQDAKIRRTTAAAPAGREVALVPEHQASLWTRYDFSPRIGGGLGVYHQSRSFTSISNAVVLPAFTRIDAAAFVKLTEEVQLQLNVENLLGEDYFSTAHNDNNIMPGAPTTARATVRLNF